MKDLIDRQETIKEIKELANLYPYKVIGDRESYSTYNEAWSDCVDMAESAVLNQLTVEAIPIEWIKERMNNIEDTVLEMAWSMLISDWADRKEE
ncbi:MAG: hypothetical protein IKE94_15885 [Aeriscardovia sp.]|nr:hypothetical protein [Aeriscardovia sp.]